MRPGHKYTPELVADITTTIRKRLSARHVPSYTFEISDIPVSLSRSCHVQLAKYSSQYTVNGKKIEIAVKQIVSGSNLQPSGTVANPESLKLYYKYRDIESVVGATKAKLQQNEYAHCKAFDRYAVSALSSDEATRTSLNTRRIGSHIVLEALLKCNSSGPIDISLEMEMYVSDKPQFA